MSSVKKTGIFIRVTQEEKEQAREQMKKAGLNNMSEYIRRMMLNGQIVRQEFQDLKDLTTQIGRIGGNVNQIAKRANERRVVPQEDIDEVLGCMRKVMRVVDSEIRRVLRS
jgi:hypothetical protein